MSKDSELVQKSIDFSIELSNYYDWLCTEKRDYIISKQIFRSGTSVGANIHEGIYASSRADFSNKLRIALKEASETEYWFVILENTNKLPIEFISLKNRCKSLIRMLIRSLSTLKDNDESPNQIQE